MCYVYEIERLLVEGRLWTWLKFFKEGGEIDLDSPPKWMGGKIMKEVMMIVREFTSEEKKRSLYFAQKDALREQVTFRNSWIRKAEKAQADLEHEKTRANQEKAKADKYKAKLLEMGIDPDQLS